jgi:hypothetical protein
VNARLLLATALGASDRAALQSLIPLAGAVGAGTIFSLFAGTRRGAALRVFEVFAIVAVLTAAALTAATAIDLLHANEAISNRELTQTAMPLVIATLLLVVVSVFNRVSATAEVPSAAPSSRGYAVWSSWAMYRRPSELAPNLPAVDGDQQPGLSGWVRLGPEPSGIRQPDYCGAPAG